MTLADQGAALFARDRGAGGQHVEAPMIDASLAFFWPDAMMRQTFVGGDEIPGVTTTDVYHLWHTRDGRMAAAFSPFAGFWES